MKKLDTSSVAGTTGLPIKSGSIQHLQNAYIENFQDIIESIIGLPNNSSTVYVLRGLVKSSSTSTFSVTAGIVYYQGEIFRVPATASHTYSLVAVLNIATGFFTAANADPVVFTDIVSRNVHQIRTMAITDAATGSGIADLSAADYNYSVEWNELLLDASNVFVTAGTYTYDPLSKLKWKIIGKTIHVLITLIPTGTSTTNTQFSITAPEIPKTQSFFMAVRKTQTGTSSIECQVSSTFTFRLVGTYGTAFPAMPVNEAYFALFTYEIQ